MTLIELWAYIRDGGMLALLFLILIGGWKRYWVFGSMRLPPAPGTQTSPIVTALSRPAGDAAIVLSCPTPGPPASVLVSMLSNAKHNKIFRSVVVLITVQVVDVLLRLKWTTEHLLSDHPMLVHVLLAGADLQSHVVSVRSVASTFPSGVVCSGHATARLHATNGRAPVGTVDRLVRLQGGPTHRTRKSVGHEHSPVPHLRNDNRPNP